ncbi:MAG: ATP-binding protein [Trueperaceae bacterium]
MPRGRNLAEYGDAMPDQDLHEQLRVRAEQQAIVAELGVYALAGADLQALMDRAVRQTSQTLKVDFCKVLELLPAGDKLLLKAGVGWQDGLVGKGTVGSDLDSQAGYTLRSKEPIIVEDLRTETRFRGPALLVEHGVISGMSVIIYGGEGLYGVLGTHSRQRRPFSSNDIHFIQGVANVLGAAVERRHFEDRLTAAHDDLERRVEERTGELTSANEELESFSYSVSHDLRAPLRGIEGFSQALLEDYGDKLDADGNQYLLRVRTGAQRMGNLIDDLLDLSRFSSVKVSLAEVNLSKLAAATVEDLRQREPEREIDVAIGADLTVEGDEALLRIVIANLLENAWKFTSQRHPARIEVGVICKPDGDVFYVRDNGAGFDMAHSERLFVPFQRLHGQDAFEGTGIGLATVKRIIGKHGGKIWAESEPGKGASFYFTLGRAKVNGVDAT